MTKPRFCGSVDFGAASVRSLPIVAGRRVTASGVQIEADAGISLAVDGARIAVASGRPRFPAPHAPGADDALHWLSLWRDEGHAAPERVKGSYAVALIDVADRTALLAVDRFAIEPLCYATDGRFLSFSDRAEGVTPAARARDIDAQSIYDYLYFHVIPAPRTIFEGVLRLQGGCRMTIADCNSRVARHWTAAFRERERAPLPELAREFRRLVRESVTREAEGSGVGSYLSGGTDSSTIAGFIGEATGAPARTFSIGFDVRSYDELEYARVASRHFRTDHHEYRLRPADLIDDIPRIAERYDQPFGNSSAAPAYRCAMLARQSGVDILLAGDGGDELFGGNVRYARQRVFAIYDRVPAWLRARALEPLLLAMPGLDRLPVIRKAASFVAQARVPMPERMETYNLLLRIGTAQILEPDFLASIDPQEPLAQQRTTYAETRDAGPFNRMLAYDWKYTLADNDLPKVVETAHLAGVQARFPLLSDELVDFSLTLRPELKLKGLTLRYFFKEALRGFLPDAVIAKKKHGFGLPFGVWVAQEPALRAFAAASLERLRDRGIVRRDFLRAILDTRLAEHPSYYGEMVWILLMLSEWMRAHATATPPQFATAQR